METEANISQKAKPKSPAGNSLNYIRDMFGGSSDKSGSEIASGVRNILSSTILKGLPAPLSFIAPVIVEKVIMKYGVEEGREVLLKGLRWVKKVTDEKPELAS